MGPLLNVLIVVYLLALLVALAVTPLILHFSHRWRLFDDKDHRKIHRGNIPRLGGIAIFTAFLVSILFARYYFGYLAEKPAFLCGLLISSSIIFSLGIYDDLAGTNARVKFTFQILAALILMAFGLKIDLVTNPLTSESVHLGLLAYPVTILWLVGITNAMNLMDGLDGLASGVALIATITIAITAYHLVNRELLILAAILAGSVIGFLPYNFNPASIFMGDTGSLFLGFVLAAITIDGSQKSSTAFAIFIPVIILGLPVIDTSAAIFRRFLAGRPIFEADQEHIHHRLLRYGLTHRQVVLSLYLVCVIFGLIAFTLTMVTDRFISLILLMITTVLFSSIHFFSTYVKSDRTAKNNTANFGTDKEIEMQDSIDETDQCA